MLYIVCFSQKSVNTGSAADAVRLVFPYKQQEKCSFLSMVDVSLSGGGIVRRRTLALPMEKLFADRIVLIHCRRRIILVRLVECDKGNVNFLIRQILYAFAHGRGLQEIQRNQYLVARIIVNRADNQTRCQRAHR